MKHKKIWKLNLTGDTPEWMPLSGVRFVREMVEEALEEAGVEGVGGTIKFGRDASIRKRKWSDPGSLAVRPTITENSITLFAVGEDTRNDLCEVVVSLPQVLRTKFREFFRIQEGEVYRLKSIVKREGARSSPQKEVAEPAVLPQEPQPSDLDSLALYLHDIRGAGGEVTEITARSFANRLTDRVDLFGQAVGEGCLESVEGIYRLTVKGAVLVHHKFDRLPEIQISPTPSVGPHRFDELRSTLLEARRKYEEAKVAHDKYAGQRQELSRQLKAAGQAETSSLSRIANLEAELEAVQRAHKPIRARTLELEEQMRQLPEEINLTIIETEMERAQRAYDDFIKT